MKKYLSLILTLALIFSLTGSVQTISAKTDYAINKTTLTLYIDTQYKLKIAGYSNFIMWKSDNTKVATVSSKGVVKAKKEGSVTITATIGSGSNNKKFTCKVSVKNRISTNKKSITSSLDEFQELKVALKKPKKDERLAVIIDDSTIIDTEWGSSDTENILNIIPKKVGYTEITICTVIGSGLSEKINTDSGITLGVTILEDNSGWISESVLYEFGVSVLNYENSINLSYGENSYVSTDYFLISDIPDKLEEGTIYKGNDISYKFIDKQFYFKISELRKLKVLK
jgi:hypothetical protein